MPTALLTGNLGECVPERGVLPGTCPAPGHGTLLLAVLAPLSGAGTRASTGQGKVSGQLEMRFSS